MSITYVKVNVGDPEVVELARQLGAEPKTVCGMINQDRYRREYNRQHNRQMSLLRRAMKEHPELAKEVKL